MKLIGKSAEFGIAGRDDFFSWLVVPVTTTTSATFSLR